MANPWDGSAETYRAEAGRISFYRITNQELVASATVRPGMTVVDLACGAGLTTQALLAAVGETGAVYAVDQTEEMLRQARAALAGAPGPAVRFVHASADAFARFVPEPADRVLCNAAFWHFPDSGAVLREVRTALRSDGRFLFNLPNQVFDFGDGRRSEMEQVVAACLGQSTGVAVPEHSEATIRTLADAGGFGVAGFRVIEVELSRDDLARFYAIPHVGARRFPDRTPDERRHLFAEAFGQLPPGGSVPYRWALFALVPQALQAGEGRRSGGQAAHRSRSSLPRGRWRGTTAGRRTERVRRRP